MKSVIPALVLILAAMPWPLVGQTSGTAQPETSRPETAEAVLGVLEQQILPDLETRRQRAQVRQSTAQEYFSGDPEVTWQRAFPELANAPLGSVGYLRTERRNLADAALRRATERVEAPDWGDIDVLPPEERDRWRQDLASTLDAEDTADRAKDRFLAGILAGLERAPGLRDSAVEDRLEALRDILRDPSLAEAPTDAEPAVDAGPRRRATLAGDELAQLGRMRELAWRTMTVPGDTSLLDTVRVDLERLSAAPVPANDGSITRWIFDLRRERLGRARPLFPASSGVGEALDGLRLRDLRQQVEAIRVRMAQLPEDDTEGPPTPTPVPGTLDTPSETELEDRQRSLQSGLAQVAEELARIDPVEEPRRAELLQLDRERLELLILETEQRLEQTQQSAQARARAVAATAAESQAKAEEARQEVDEARQELESVSPLTKKTLELREQIALILEEEARRQERTVETLDELQGQYEASRQEAETAIAMSRLDGDRPDALATALRTNHRTVLAIHAWLEKQRDAFDALEADRRQRLTVIERPLDIVASNEDKIAYEDALETYRAALDTREFHALAEREAAYALLAEAKVSRRPLMPLVQHRARYQILETFSRELLYEVHEVPDLAHRRWLSLRTLVENPRDTLYGMGPWDLLARCLVLLGILVGWGKLRRRVSTGLAEFLQQLDQWHRKRQRQRRQIRRKIRRRQWNIRDLSKPAEPVVRYALDATAILLLHVLLFRFIPVVGFVVLLLWSVLLVRTVSGVFALSLASRADRRPALWSVSERDRDRILKSLRWILIWGLTAWIAHHVAFNILDGDRLSDLVIVFAWLTGILVAVHLLRHWSDPLRYRAAQYRDDRLGRWLTDPAPSRLGLLLRGAAGAVGLLGRQVARALLGLSDESDDFAWVGNALVRRDLADADTVNIPLLPEQCAAISNVRGHLESPRRYESPFEANEQALRGAFLGWCQEQRQGLAVVLGERGIGKSDFLGRVPEILAKGRSQGDSNLSVADLTLHRWSLDRHLFGGAEGLGWLAESLEVSTEGSETEAELERRILEHLAERPPSLFLVDDFQFLFLRTIGGSEALQTVLGTLLEASDRHFWVLTLQQPAWNYAKGFAIDPGLFRCVLELPTWTQLELSQWLEQRTRKAGFSMRFERLLPETLVGKSDVALERVTQAFWRLLKDTSQGIPEIATAYWLEALCRDDSDPPVPEATGPRTLSVSLFQPPDKDQIEALHDDALFILTALVVHKCLTLELLSKILELPEKTVRRSCRHLKALGAVKPYDHGSYTLCVRWRIPVRRVLRQKHFLYTGG